MTESNETIVQVLEQNRDAIMGLPHVVGVGLAKCGDELCIRVMVTERTDELTAQLDTLLGEHPFEVDETEPFHSLPSADES